MCGIVGLFSRKCTNLEKITLRMRDIFPYRGPDDKGIWVCRNGTVAIGHRRLSIIDPTPGGHQPMHDSDAGLTIVYNGEVYNYLEIRKELQKKGYSFKTKSDTEVILASYREWGQECLQHFNGMFAFALWDEKRNSLFLARDRLGIKPLYYYRNGDELYFASEPKALLAVLPEQPSIADHLIDTYMSFGYIPGEDTLHEGIKRLLPGHSMTISDNAVKIKCYWDLYFHNDVDRGFDYYINRTRELLNSAIDLRLRSDVPLGIFLSGGIDSSTVVGLLAPRVIEPLKTFSVAFDAGPQFDETSYAQIVAKEFNTDHHEIFITPDQFQEFIPKFVWLMDEPVTEAAAISLYFVSKLAKDHVTVVLSGEGSDELFAGYDLYHYMSIIEKYRTMLGRKSSEILANIAKFLPLGHKLAKYIILCGLSFEKRYKGISTYEERYKERLYSHEYSTLIQDSHCHDLQDYLGCLFTATRSNDIISRMLYFDTKTWLVDDLLIKADRMSMAASLELRVPFLDHRLVEFAATIPSKYKSNKGEGKFILKQMMKEILPEEIISRKKMGFPTPLKIMFRDRLYDYSRDVLLSQSACIRKYFRINAIESLLTEHAQKKYDHHRILWQLIVLENWLRCNIKAFESR